MEKEASRGIRRDTRTGLTVATQVPGWDMIFDVSPRVLEKKKKRWV
jgi:hypothetical protein